MHIGFHLAAGMAVDAGSSGDTVSMVAAGTLAVLSHWPIDDLNVGDAKLSHMVGRFGIDAKIVYWMGVVLGLAVAVCYTFMWAETWWKALVLLCAAISLDWERLTEKLGLTTNNQLHKLMWHKALLHSKWSFYIKLGVVILIGLWVQPYV